MAKCFGCGIETEHIGVFFDTGKGPLYLCQICARQGTTGGNRVTRAKGTTNEEEIKNRPDVEKEY